jgi:hypothetical protein
MRQGLARGPPRVQHGSVGEDHPDQTPTRWRYTVVEAVRSRIKGGTLENTKEGATVYVLLSPDLAPPEQRPDALLDAKDETIALLREQLEAQRRANEENRRIIAALTSRIPELRPAVPREPSESPTAAAGESQASPPPGYQRRSGGRRVPVLVEEDVWWLIDCKQLIVGGAKDEHLSHDSATGDRRFQGGVLGDRGGG